MVPSATWVPTRVQLAKEAGAEVIGTAHTNGVDYVRQFGADEVIDVNTRHFEECAKNVDRTSSF